MTGHHDATNIYPTTSIYLTRSLHTDKSRQRWRTANQSFYLAVLEVSRRLTSMTTSVFANSHHALDAVSHAIFSRKDTRSSSSTLTKMSWFTLPKLI